MLIEAYILCWNEEKLLPFTLEHYSSFCDVIHLLDNHSCDDSLKIAETFPKVTVTQWESPEGPDMYDERSNILMKNCSYDDLGVGADWVCIVDCDEFVYHPRLREKLEDYMYDGITLPKTVGYDMISEEFPTPGSPLTEQITKGIYEPGMSKRSVFDPRIGIKYACGSHDSGVSPNYGMVGEYNEEGVERVALPPRYTSTLVPVESPEDEILYGEAIKILHYKDLSASYKIERLKRLSARMSDWCLDNAQSIHWLQTEEEIHAYFKKRLPIAQDVI